MRRISSKVIRPNGLIESRIPPTVRKAVYERDDFTCKDCGTKGKPGRTRGSIQAYHLLPLREGGEHTLDNLITVCYSCRKRRDDERRKAKPVSRSSFRWRKLKDNK
jgi:5-methylcytosine-specific restriction endonuclease McrA